MSSMTTDVGQRIVCAAMRSHSGFVIAGVRHFDGIMRESAIRYSETNPLHNGMWTQGFVDNKG
jgi:hypothetical protein